MPPAGSPLDFPFLDKPLLPPRRRFNHRFEQSGPAATNSAE
jgi:hypothetical protein